MQHQAMKQKRKRKKGKQKREALSFGLSRECKETYEMVYHILIFTIVESIKNN